MIFNPFHYLFIFSIITIIAFGATPVFRSIAKKFKLLDYPGGRKLHSSPVAYLGGLAVATPISLGSLLVVFTSISMDLKNQFYLGLILPSLVIAFIGLLDDLYQLPPWPRFIMQSFVGLVTSFMLFISGGGFKLFESSWINGLLTSLWVVTIINALNFMDNMDGLATTISILIATALFVLSYLNGQYLVATLCISLSAACIGFLFWNKRPASIYLGDAGALYLGFLLSAISIRIDIETSTEVTRVMILLLIFAIPVIDIAQVVISRVVKGKSPFKGGRDHLSHLLLEKGLSEGWVLTIFAASSSIFTLSGVFLAIGNR